MSGVTRLTTANPQVVFSLDVSADGAKLAIGQQGDARSRLALTLWSLHDGRQLATLVEGEGALPLARFAPGGWLLAHTDAEQRLVLHDLRTDTVDRGAFPLPFTKWMSFAANRDRLLAGGTQTRVWDADAGAVVWTLPADPLPAHAGISPPVCALSPDGERVAASGVEPGRIVLYDVAGGRVAGRVEGTMNQARSMAWDPSGRYLAAVATTGRAGVWDLRTGEPVLPALQDERADYYWCVRFHPDGGRVAFGLWSGFVQRVHLPDGGLDLGGEPPDHRGRVYDLAFTPDGRRLASGGDDGVVVIRDVGEADWQGNDRSR
jgi:WD40 repeat protein